MNERKVELGSQIFVNRDDSPETIRTWVRRFDEAGLRVIRIFLFWDHVERREGVWDFTQYDALFDEAAARALSVVVTLMPVSPPGWMRLTGGVQDVGDLDDPVFWSRALDYVTRAARRYTSHPALHSWILWNEPSRRVPRCPSSMRAYRAYLEKAYGGDIEALNRLHYRQYDSFSRIGEGEEAATQAMSFTGYAEALDWMRFNVANLTEKLSDIAAAVRKEDDHPIHINPHGLAYHELQGQSIFEQAKLVDFIGCSAHPSWHSSRFPREYLARSVAYFADLMKSATCAPDGRFWVTELQGGTNIFSGWEYLCPDEKTLSLWLWESIASGAEKAVFWCFNTRTDGFEAGEWGLAAQDGGPSARTRAAGAVARTLRENAQLFTAARAPRPRVWILYSIDSWNLAAVEGRDNDKRNPRNRYHTSDALCSAYLMLGDLSIEAGFIDEEGIVQGRIGAGDILIAPGTFSMRAEHVRAVEAFVARGGTLIADGLFAYKDQNGYLVEENRACAERIFAASLHDISCTEQPLRMDAPFGAADGWFLRIDTAAQSGCVSLASFEDGAPAVTQCVNASGGSAVRINSVFFQKYIVEPDGERLAFFAALLKKLGVSPSALRNPTASLHLRTLETPEGALLFLMNAGDGAQACVACAAQDEVSLISGGGALRREGDAVCVEVPACSAAVLRVKRG